MHDEFDAMPVDDSAARPGVSRRSIMVTLGAGAAGVAGAAVAGRASAAGAEPVSGSRGFATRVRVAENVEVFVQDLDGGNRGTILFVPGWPLSSGTFEVQLCYFAEQGFRAIGVDQRGFGRSDAPWGPYNYDVWAADLLQIERALGLRDVTVVGHSMGGAVALRHAARFGRRVGKLVLVEGSAPCYVFGAQSPALAEGLTGLIDGYKFDRAETVRNLAKIFFATHTDVDHDPYLQWFQRQGVDEASLQASRAGLIALRDANLAPDTRLVTVPTRVFHAVHDMVVPYDHGQALAADIAGARLITFPAGGHGIYVDEPQRFNRELLAFVS